ncbi:hypothetical protein ACIQCN_04085 [Pseudarthrobacter sp. NPDC092424]|uniref:hypothetical protein n=1 Tax=Pseudarthrobacter sp. NPDC092424 TaxID=3364415 RepID=UPI00380CD851
MNAGSLLRPAAALRSVGNCYAHEGKNCAHSGNEGREEEAQARQDRQGYDAAEIG